MKASSEPSVSTAALSWLDELAPIGNQRIRVLGRRDEANEKAHAAYLLGRQRGYDAGLSAGRDQGYAQGAQVLAAARTGEAQQVAHSLNDLATRFQEQLVALESEIATDLVSLAIDIAREVLRREVAMTPDGLLPVATEALRALGEGASHMEMRVHPEDAVALRDHLSSYPGGARCHLRADTSITRGGLRLEADTGVVDATFEARWQSVMATLGRDEEPLP